MGVRMGLPMAACTGIGKYAGQVSSVVQIIAPEESVKVG